MRWKVVDNTLIIEGDFYALSSGLLGGFGSVEYIFNHTVRHNKLEQPVVYLKEVADRFSMNRYFGLLTSVPMERLSVVVEQDVTVFATAGIKNHNEKIGTINIVVLVEGDMSDNTIVNAVITTTEAKSKALLEDGFDFTGTSTDAVIVAKMGNGSFYEYSGPASRLGRKIWRAVIEAVSGSLGKGE